MQEDKRKEDIREETREDCSQEDNNEDREERHKEIFCKSWKNAKRIIRKEVDARE